ncbi:efflux RND transporter periplasmic adaptor subunit, partial [Candidatus Riflebacteria bacterium]
CFLCFKLIFKKREELSLKKIVSEISKERAKLKTTELKAPRDGIIFYIESWRGKPKKGMQAWRGMRLLKVVNPDRIKISTKVDEKDIEQIYLKQDCEIQFFSNPGKKFKGEVSMVGKLAKPRDKMDPKGPKFFDVEVKLISIPKMKIGLNTTTLVFFKSKKFLNVRKIPRDYVFEEELTNNKNDTALFVYLDEKLNKKEFKKEEILYADEDYYILKKGALINVEKIYLAP